MKMQLCAGIISLFLLSTGVEAQERNRHFTNPSLPSREALQRLHLVQAWYSVIPVDGRRDSLLTVQLWGKDLFVQTRAGLVTRLDAETGRVYWRTILGNPFQTGQPLGFNSVSVFAVNSNDLYSLDRKNGDIEWRYRMPAGVSTPPVADEDHLYIGMANTRIYAYDLPERDLEGKAQSALLSLQPRIASPQAREAQISDGASSNPTIPDLYRTSNAQVGPHPTVAWSALTNIRLELSPLLTKDDLILPSPAGEVRVFSKGSLGDTPGQETLRYPLHDIITVPPTRYGDVVYVGSHDANLYAIDVASGRLVWRFTAGTPIVRQPVALQKDVFLTAKANGMARLDRDTGLPLWRVQEGSRILEFNPEADQFLAANKTYVYALDRSGRLLVIDRARGATLSRYDLKGFTVAVSNEVTDRIYLAAHNGLVVCLRHQDLATPESHRKILSPREILEQKLSQPITQPQGPPLPFVAMVKELARKYDIEIKVSERAYKTLDADSLLSKLVNQPAAQQRPLKDVIQDVLRQASSTSIVIDDSIVVVPSGKKPMP